MFLVEASTFGLGGAGGVFSSTTFGSTFFGTTFFGVTFLGGISSLAFSPQEQMLLFASKLLLRFFLPLWVLVEELSFLLVYWRPLLWAEFFRFLGLKFQSSLPSHN